MRELFLANWDSSAGKWVEVESTLDLAAHMLSTRINHFSTYAIMAHTRPASFEVADLSVTPGEIDYGKDIEISILVTNIGNLTGIYQASLKIDDAVLTKDVALEGGTSQRVSFRVTPDTPGKHNVSIGGLSGTFQVNELELTSGPVAKPAPARFTLSGLSVTPIEAAPVLLIC